MTPEQKRDQLLKRILPGMAITVIYFVFISGIMSAKMDKAETSYRTITTKGVSKTALPDATKEADQIQQKITELKQQQQQFKQQLTDSAGFLYNGSPSNAATEQLATIMAENDINITEELREEISEELLETSLREVWYWLKPPKQEVKPANADKPTDNINNKAVKVEKPIDDKKNKDSSVIYTQHLWLRGNYLSMYRAMSTLADSQLKAIPVQLTMRTPEDDSVSGELEWELILWM